MSINNCSHMVSQPFNQPVIVVSDKSSVYSNIANNVFACQQSNNSVLCQTFNEHDYQSGSSVHLSALPQVSVIQSDVLLLTVSINLCHCVPGLSMEASFNSLTVTDCGAAHSFLCVFSCFIF